ncbi:hypothetical protein I316_06734 [Kwoniella heveanensis BCC8398]|uniref:MPN domain-containing protein n=1 Tax=Kwoniella heveanensis BCC8398 TaxID=1296120 RepID=A0A1B9GKS4_9TREE|nr:hypothetical protein I316_06734 [Kwoniella heveanensis BCC8398]
MAATSSTTTKYTYTLTPLSYTLPILHAARYPSSTVIGVFLSSSSLGSESAELPIAVDEAIPLIHQHTTLSPITKASLSLVEEYAKLNKKRIVGIYVARAAEFAGAGLGRSGERILRALRESWDGVFGLLLDDEKLTAGEAAYIPYLPVANSPDFKPSTSNPTLTDSGSNTLPGPFSLPELPANLPTRVIEVIREQRIHSDLRDFDDHLDDP